MKRYWILGGVTVLTVLALLLLSVILPVAVKTVTIEQQQAVKTELCPARVTDQTHLQVFLRESLASLVKPGQTAFVSGAGFSEATYDGTVSSVASEATVQNGKTVVPAVVTLENGDDSVKKGLSATVRVAVGIYDDAVIVKDEWMNTDEAGAFVWVAEQGKARRHPLQLSEMVDGGTLTTNLPAGTQLIISPSTLRSGRRIREVSARD